MIYEKKCPQCKRSFVTDLDTQKYCSIACKEKADDSNTIEKDLGEESCIGTERRTCVGCGRTFLWSRSQPDQIYCSPRCREEHTSREKKKEYLTEERECLFCGKLFMWTSKKSGQKYCSVDCQKQMTKRNSLTNKQKKVTILDVEVESIVTELIRRAKERGAGFNGAAIDYRLVGDISDRTREVVLERDQHQCRVCGQKYDLHLHHIIKRRYGGPHSADNLITLCSSCHRHIETGNLDYAIRKCKKNARRNYQGNDREKQEEQEWTIGHAIFVLQQLFKDFCRDYPSDDEYLVKIDSIIEALEKLQE